LGLLKYHETPVQEIHDPLLDSFGLRLLVKREDLNHPFVSGNKWWKLKYNLTEAKKLGKKKILTFGGAYSNHIYATAAAAKETGFESVGIIRGEETQPLNSTLAFAKEQGMHLHYVSRETYRNKTDEKFIDDLRTIFGDFYVIPECGTNALAVKGCEELGNKILSEIDFDVVCLPVGTGGTMAGLINGLGGKKEVLGFSVLKGGEFLEKEVARFLTVEGKQSPCWAIKTDYHFGGYGKKTLGLENFIMAQRASHHLALDEVYTGKMFFGIYDLISQSNIKRGSTVLGIHTGGLRDNSTQ